VTLTRNIAVMESCNECHSDLAFHGRRFRVEYCVNCHNPDLASGVGPLRHALADGRRALATYLEAQGVRLPKPNLPKGPRPKDARSDAEE
jgi:hypothetical protein